jgi:phosphoglycerate dehydrogenase-like enzyme/MFS family permease
MALKVLVTDHTFDPLDIEQQILEPLGAVLDARQCKSTLQILPLVADADAIITQFSPVNAQVIAAMKKALVIVRYGVGVDNVDLQAARECGIPVCNVPAYCIDEVADHTLAFILSLTPQVVPNCLHVRSGHWGLGAPLPEMKTLRDMMIGVAGFGRIGREVVRRLLPFCGLVCVFDPLVNRQEITSAGASQVASLDELLAQSDIVTLHCPSTPQTRRMINADSLAKLKRGSILINPARGDLVDTQALVTPCRAGIWAGLGGVIAPLVGNPLSGWILQSLDQVGGLWGWQWVFLLGGLPAVLLGLVTLAYLTDRPDQAGWLTPEERTWLAKEIEHDTKLPSPNRRQSLASAVLDHRVWLLIAVYFTAAMGDNSYGFYIPTFLKGRFPGWTPLRIGLLAAAPSAIAMIGMIAVGRHSDRTGERRWHVACSAFAAAFGWLMIALVGILTLPEVDANWVFVGAVAVTLTGMKSMLPTFWTLPPTFLTGAASAGGIALINSVANLGGFLGPMIMGHVQKATGTFTAGYVVMAIALSAGGLLVLAVTNRPGTARR